MSECNCGVIFPDPDPTTRGIIISCEERLGHEGAHKGFDLSRRYGAIWNPDRLLKVYKGDRGDDVTQEPA